MLTLALALGLHLAPCVQGKTKTPAQCGTFGVYENRGAKTGRIIPLHVVVLRAVHARRGVITEISGGPGEAATKSAGYLVDGDMGKPRLALHENYDYLFVDNRGMGASNPFTCDFAPAGDPAAYFRYLFPPRLVAACRHADAATHDFSQYNTRNAVDDLDDVRAALGYRKLILDGGSYGTFFSLVYIRRHPNHVESAVLDGVAPPGFQPLPGDPVGAQRAINDLFAKCRGDAACSRRFPYFAAHFSALLARFGRGPLMVPAGNPVSKKTVLVALSKEVFVDELRHVLYDSAAAAYVPYVVERAYARDYAPLGAMMQTVITGFSQDINMGSYLAYSCSDFMPFITPAQLAYVRMHSFAGDLRIRAQQQACLTFNEPPMPATFNDPVRSGTPILMIAGSDDPATPPHYGEEALRYLPNAREVLVKGGGHGADTPCTGKLFVAFVHAASAKGLDVNRCSATFTLPPFATSMKGWP